MASTSTPTTPVPVELPALGSDAYFDEVQWQVLLALIDTVVPSIVVDSAAEDKRHHLQISQKQLQESYENTRRFIIYPPAFAKFEEYLKARPLENKRFLLQVRRTMTNLPPHLRRQLGGILSILA